jgi:hypothetical protein
MYCSTCFGWGYPSSAAGTAVITASGIDTHESVLTQQPERMVVDPINPLTPNDPYSGRTTPLTSKRCILYIYSTNKGTAYFKHGIYSPFLSSSKCSLFHNSNIFGSCIIHILYTGFAKI